MTLDISTKVPIACLVALFVVWVDRRNRRSKLPLPPGPKKLPIVGNLFDIPEGEQWIQYHEWSQEFGGTLFTTSLVHLTHALQKRT